VIQFDEKLTIKFHLDPASAVNPTGINTLLVEHGPESIISALSSTGVDVSKNPLFNALKGWINDYYWEWRSLNI
jgi:hypothetical protein